LQVKNGLPMLFARGYTSIQEKGQKSQENAEIKDPAPFYESSNGIFLDLVKN